MSAWSERVVEKIAEHRGKLQPQDDELRSEQRIEPSVDADPLMDDKRSRLQQNDDGSKVPSKNADSGNHDVSYTHLTTPTKTLRSFSTLAIISTITLYMIF